MNLPEKVDTLGRLSRARLGPAAKRQCRPGCNATADMSRVRRTNVEVQAARESARIGATLGSDLQHTRKRRRMTQEALGKRIGLGQGRISELERGHGATTPLETWIALGIAIDRPLAVSFSRDIQPDEPRDAGHLAAQELVLRLARQHRRHADFELPTRPTDPTRSIDVALRDATARVLIVVEIWNRLDDLGAAVRATSRKQAEAEGPAVLAAGDGPPYRVTTCWLLVDTTANRRLVARYPEILETRFPGSSFGWVCCLSNGAPPPTEPGLAWIDPRSGRIVPLRRRSKA
jgi:transcriptional regulator with XRE-family HTH domain